jgi:hypothetical protein
VHNYTEIMKPIKCVLLSILLIALFGCKPRLINDKNDLIWPQYYTNALIRKVISQNMHQCNLYVNKSPLWYYQNLDDIMNYNAGFTFADTLFLRQQLSLNKQFVFPFETMNYDGVEFLSYDTLSAWGLGSERVIDFWDIYREKVNQCFCLVFCPIYNNDKSLAIISFSHLCGGNWIEVYHFLYKRERNEWQFVDTLETGGS